MPLVLAGIDEAGYGPILGPMVVGCCAVQIDNCDADAPQDPPDLWRLLRPCVSRTRDRRGRKLHINDSKQVYTPAAGLGQLEKGVLSWLVASSGAAGGGELLESWEAVVNAAAPGEVPAGEHSRWYAADAGAHPAGNDRPAVAIAANALRHGLTAAGIRPLELRAHLLFEPEFNRLCRATRNKSSVLFSTTARHLDRLLTALHHGDFGDAELHVVCDRHGGRIHYGHVLRLMFDQWSLTIEEERPARAVYLLERSGRRARLCFAEKADGHCLPTALASMLAKYLRERLMGRFNAFWSREVPDLKPTAGYWSDGLRFLSDIAEARRRLQVRDAHLVRER